MKVTLLVVQGRPSGKQLMFPTGEYFFGRGVECHVRPDSDWVSRQHCLLRVTSTGAFIKDLGSRNGTLVNGALLVREQSLREGDHIQIGPLVFEVFAVQAESQVRASQATLPTSVMSNDQTIDVAKKDAPEKGRPINDNMGSTVNLQPMTPEEVADFLKK